MRSCYFYFFHSFYFISILYVCLWSEVDSQSISIFFFFRFDSIWFRCVIFAHLSFSFYLFFFFLLHRHFCCRWRPQLNRRYRYCGRFCLHFSFSFLCFFFCLPFFFLHFICEADCCCCCCGRGCREEFCFFYFALSHFAPCPNVPNIRCALCTNRYRRDMGHTCMRMYLKNFVDLSWIFFPVLRRS